MRSFRIGIAGQILCQQAIPATAFDPMAPATANTYSAAGISKSISLWLFAQDSHVVTTVVIRKLFVS